MNVRHLVERLEGAGLVAIGADPGRGQCHLVWASAEGVSFAEEVARRAAARSRYVAGLLGVDELATLPDLPDRLQERLSSADTVASIHEGRAAGVQRHEREAR